MTYQDDLDAHAEPREWLEARGLAKETWEAFGIGYVAKPGAGHGKYRNRIAIPYLDGRERIRGWRFRSLVPNADHKYLSPYKQPAHIFAVRATDHPKVIVTEGEFDAMVCWQLGFRACALPGAAIWKPQWKWLFRNAEEVVIALDGDDAGRKGRNKVWRDIDKVSNARVAELPSGKDITDMFLADPSGDSLKEIL